MNNGSEYKAIEGQAIPINPSGYTSTAIGVYGHALNARKAMGLQGYGKVDITSSSMSPYGAVIEGELINGGVNQFAYGAYCTATTFASPNAGGAYAVFGNMAAPTGAPNFWAGYFVGDVHVTGALTQGSDANLKTDIQPLENAVEVLMALQPKRYNFRTEEYPYMNLPGGEHMGLIAQEVQEVLPALIKPAVRPAEFDTAGLEIHPAMDYLTMNYTELIPLLVAGFQAQQQVIVGLQAQVAQCCAANPGMAPQDGAAPKQGTGSGELQDQRLQIIPNPVAELTTWAYHVPKAGKVSLLVSTMEGKPVATLREEMAEAGAYQYTWNTGKLAAGTYLCTYLLDGAVVVQKAVKLR